MGPEKGVITTRVFSLEDSLEFPKSRSGSSRISREWLDSPLFSTLSGLSKLSRICRVTGKLDIFERRPLFRKTLFSNPDCLTDLASFVPQPANSRGTQFHTPNLKADNFEPLPWCVFVPRLLELQGSINQNFESQTLRFPIASTNRSANMSLLRFCVMENESNMAKI